MKANACFNHLSSHLSLSLSVALIFFFFFLSFLSQDYFTHFELSQS